MRASDYAVVLLFAMAQLAAPFAAGQQMAAVASPDCPFGAPDSLEISWTRPCDENDWVLDTGGCRIGDWHPATEDRAIWNGACPAGSKQGRGAVQWYEHGHAIDRFDIGGGLGIVYADEKPPSIASFMQLVAKETDGLGCELTFEPGRRLVGEAGVLVAEVILVKPGVSKTFVIVDAAMNDLIRPTLYEAWHDIVPVRRPRPGAATIRCDIVGPVCESGDYLAQNRDLPSLSAGDLVMIRSAGAYGAVMASSYNSRPLAPEVMVDGTRFAVVRARPSIDEMLSSERFPPWMEPA